MVSVVDANGKSGRREGWLLDGHFETTLALNPEYGPFAVSISSVLGTRRADIAIADAPRSANVRGAE